MKKLAQNLGLAVGAGILTLVLAELALRMFLDSPDYTYDRWGIPRYEPHFSSLVYNAERGAPVLRETNSLGFPGSGDVAPEKSARRIAILGDSFTEGKGVSRRDAFPAKLGEILGSGAEVLNFGVAGLGAVEELEVLRRDVLSLRPDDVVLAVYLGNDPSDTAAYFTQSGTILAGDLDAVSPRLVESDADWKLWLIRHSRIVSIAFAKVGSLPVVGPIAEKIGLISRPNADTGRPTAVAQLIPGDPESEKLSFLADVAGRIRDESRAAGATFHVVLIPTKFQIDPELLSGSLAARPELGLAPSDLDADLPNRTLTELLAARGIGPLDLTPLLRAEEKGTETYLGFHFNERGHELAAEALARELSTER